MQEYNKMKFYNQVQKVSLQMNILSNMDQISDIIIRPSRYLYKPVDLGPKIITTTAKPIYHHDFQVKNHKGFILKASLYTQQEDIKNINIILIYLHCNSGCRIQGLAYMRMAIDNLFSYVVFDFAGSGLSQGKYVSLGHYQSEDIKAIIKHLENQININIKFILWGRSMGAVAALKYLSSNQQGILAAVFDSPFQSLKQLFLQIGKQKTNIPKIVLQVALKYLKPIVQSKAGFDIDQVNLNCLDKIKKCPAIFIASKKDSLIPFSQMDKIFKQYKSHKQMLFVQQSHNQPRNINVIKQVFVTMKKLISTSLTNYKLLQQTPQILAKDPIKKKLQLTIKSFSQKNLTSYCKSTQTPRQGLKQIKFPHIQKRYISCLFQKKKISKNTISEQLLYDDLDLNNIPSQFKSKNHHLIFKKFFKDQNYQQFPKHNLIRFKSQKQYGQININYKSKDQQRKTMQHIANKKPPFIDNHRIHQFRSSVQSKYRSQYHK